MQLDEAILSLTRSPVDSSERPEDPQNTEDLEESDAGAAEYGDKGDGDHHDVQAIEGLRKSEQLQNRSIFANIILFVYVQHVIKIPQSEYSLN
jgi:hypothetical protein